MAVQTINISLVGRFPDGRPVTSDDFVRPLAPSPSDGLRQVVADRGKWYTAFVEFADTSVDAHKAAPAPHDAFEEEVARELARIADWIGKRTAALASMAAAGLALRLIFSMWIDQNQMDLVLPPSLLRVCGEGQVGVRMITNE